MDIGLREWLIIGGVLVIGLIIFDGWRRMKGQRNTLKIDIDRSLSDAPESTSNADAHNPELPNGGARAQTRAQIEAQANYSSELLHADSVGATSSAARIDPGFEHLNDYFETGASDQLNDEAHEVELPRKVPGSGAGQQVELDPLFDDIPEILSPVRRAVVINEVDEEVAKEVSGEPEQTSEFFDLEQPITVLMRQASENRHKDNPSAATQEEISFYPEASDTHKAGADNTDAHITQGYSAEAYSSEAYNSDTDRTESDDQSVGDDHYSGKADIHQMDVGVETEDGVSSSVADDIKVFEVPENERQEEPEEVRTSSGSLFEPEVSSVRSLPEQDSLFKSDLPPQKDKLEHARSDRKAREHAPEPEEVLVITVVGKQQPLDGQTLLQVVLACGMRFGDMSLFHRFEEGIDKGAVQFSMANAVNPGTFDLEHMDEMTTPGVSFFMSMSEPADVKNAFECMLATAETVSKHLGGDLLDENRSVMRPQTKAHYRERIREYEMHNRHRRR